MTNGEETAESSEQREQRDEPAEELLAEAWRLDERVRRKAARNAVDRCDDEQLLESPELKRQIREESLLKAGACAQCVQQDSKQWHDEPHRDLVFVTASTSTQRLPQPHAGYVGIYKCRLCASEVEHSSSETQNPHWFVRAK